ncbi:MAG: hypothetical protein V1821_00570 [bacterium]
MKNYPGLRSKFESSETTAQMAPEERRVIEGRASLRREQQKLKYELANLKLPDVTEALKTHYDEDLKSVLQEAAGELKLTGDFEKLKSDAETDLLEAEEVSSFLPNLAALKAGSAVKKLEAAGCDFSAAIKRTWEYLKASEQIPSWAPSSFASQARLMGVQSRYVKNKTLPDMSRVAEACLSDNALLAEYALVLQEEDREKFLGYMPKEERQRVSAVLDGAVADVLPQALLEKGTPEEKQREKVRSRLYRELGELLSKNNTDDHQIVKTLSEALGVLGGDAKQLLLELMRDEAESRKNRPDQETRHLPRVAKVLMDNFEDWRGNDLILKLAGDRNINRHLSVYFLAKLVKNGYLEKDILEWWRERVEKAKKPSEKSSLGGEQNSLEVIRSVITDLGVTPTRDVLEFLAEDKNWVEKTKRFKVLSKDRILFLPERVEKIKASQSEFAKVQSQPELIKLLSGNEEQAKIYYLLNAGKDRFNLINNYSFGKFKEMLGLITQLKVHEKPMEDFRRALTKGGTPKKATLEIAERLRAGHFPLSDKDRARQEVSFEVSENAAVKNANLEIGRVLGREQLGCIMLFPLYREYLAADGSARAREELAEMEKVATFSDRLAELTKIEKSFPEYRKKAKKEMEDNWRRLGEKMVLGLTLDSVLDEAFVPVRGEELIPRLDSKRVDLKRANNDLLVALKGENPELKALRSGLHQKRKAQKNLQNGLEHQTDEVKRRELQDKLLKVGEEIEEIQKRQNEIANVKALARFEGLSEEDRRKEIEKLSQEIKAVMEKSPSAIFTYLTMQVVGEERLTESDVNLVREMESHLQGPFQTISDSLTYAKPGREVVKRARIQLEYLDKKDRLLNLVRFADSKICCFSSNNYEMVVQHETPNKHWVASINADPLSFVISMEQPREEGTAVTENLGFIFGNFGVDDQGKPALLLNGIYYAPGIENQTQVEVIMGGVEKIFEGLPIKTVALAAQYGGAIKMPEGYSNEAVELTRLRALDDSSGNPETKIYDDLGTSDDLNKPHLYSGSVWNKSLK